MTRLDANVGDVNFDNLLYSTEPSADVFGITVKSGQGILTRGTALAIDADGKMSILGTASTTANCILSETVDATSADATAAAYRTGHFNTQKLIVKSGYTLTAADKEAFRSKGILLSDAVQF